MKLAPFHLAIPVHNLKNARKFYRDILECEEGRSSAHWVDFNFFGHQLVIHVKENTVPKPSKDSNSVDGKAVPIPHFGVVLTWDEFWKFSESLKHKNITFEIEPHLRFEGKTGEQASMFFYDPCGNALEFKTFKDDSQLFAS